MDFNNWKDWEDELQDDSSGFDKFSEVSMFNIDGAWSMIVQISAMLSVFYCPPLQMMNTMGGVNMPDFDEADDEVYIFF